ncbi:hypothetical protein F4818DRAFT_133474 [Hypoxylon cercidicola]|nr:hypothetical protein F4818DRAFT_133474 [Hypoxylon cercidicola]
MTSHNDRAGRQGSAGAQGSAPLLLDQYVRRAARPDPHAAIDDDDYDYEPQSSSRPKPALSRHGTNRVLLYNGCFNPPHRGHLAHLVHAYRHAGADLRVVGAVVLVAGDGYLRWKFGGRSSTGTLRLPEAQRVRLWNEELAAGDGGDGGAGDWTWVLREDDWPRVVGNLERLFRRDGLDVEFVRLAGGDKVGVRDVQHGIWGCRVTLTTDVSRPVDFHDGGGGLPGTLDGHGPWRLVQEASCRAAAPEGDEADNDNNKTSQHSEAPNPSRQTITTVTAPAAIESERRSVWECDRRSYNYPRSPPYTVRFVSSDAAERLPPDLSSTKLRATIADVRSRHRPRPTPQQLEHALRPVALSPRLLARYLA